ncbi:group-specific protein [Paenibacillus sp. GYB006]|uniref:group-specific protein n=1 Tax=Paenibacillus sp. GYB006 TaxID=2994394 RepID=UPI002F96DCFB
MKSFYIASSFKNIETVRKVSERLRQEGFTHTYDWTTNNNITSIDELKDIGKKEIDAVMCSDFIIVLFPAGKGSHVELGIAIGNGIQAYLYSQNDEINDLETTSTFYHVDGVSKCKGTVEELIQTILEEQK